MAKKEKSNTRHNSALISGNVIVWARKRLGKSHQQIADEIGSSVKAEDVARWEANKNLPDFKKAQKLALALHIPFGYLFLSNPPKNDIKVPDLRTVGHGFKTAHCIGELIAEQIIEGTANIDISRFNLSRFNRGELFQAAYSGNRA